MAEVDKVMRHIETHLGKVATLTAAIEATQRAAASAQRHHERVLQQYSELHIHRMASLSRIFEHASQPYRVSAGDARVIFDLVLAEVQRRAVVVTTIASRLTAMEARLASLHATAWYVTRRAIAQYVQYKAFYREHLEHEERRVNESCQDAENILSETFTATTPSVDILRKEYEVRVAAAAQALYDAKRHASTATTRNTAPPPPLTECTLRALEMRLSDLSRTPRESQSH